MVPPGKCSSADGHCRAASLFWWRKPPEKAGCAEKFEFGFATMVQETISQKSAWPAKRHRSPTEMLFLFEVRKDESRRISDDDGRNGRKNGAPLNDIYRIILVSFVVARF
jgi:hypothetical protein